MATTVGQHTVATFTSPVNGTTPIDANTVRGNDNTLRTSYNDHDSDTGIHVQSSTFASRPVAGTAGRKWITVDVGGDLHLWYDNGTTWEEVGNASVEVLCIANSNLTAGDVVKVVGFNNGQGLPIVDIVSSGSDVGFGIVDVAIANGATGYVVNTGIARDFDTSTFAVGDVLYKNTSGGFTTTKPTSGEYQPCAIVLRSNVNNGVLYVEFSAPRIVERSDNTASTIVLRDASGNFAAGTITAGALTSTGLVTFASLKGTGATTVTNILDEDNMASDSATALATQQSIKAYVDSQVATVDTLAEILVNGNTSGGTNLIMSAGDTLTADTIAETTVGAGVTIDSVLLKDDVVNATDIETGTLSANDGTTAATIANTTGKLTISAAPTVSALTASQAVFTDASKNLVSNAITGTGNVVMSASPTLTGTVTAATLNATTLGGTLSTAAQPNVTSVGTLTSLAVSGNLTVDTNTLFVDATNNRVGIGTAGPSHTLQAVNTSAGATTYAIVTDNAGASGTTVAGFGFANAGALKSSITAAVYGNDYMTFNVGGSGTTERMRIDSSGNLAVDTDTLFVDAVNNRVGIGTASPDTKLYILQSAADINSGIKIVGSDDVISGRIWMGGGHLHIDNATAGANTGITLDDTGYVGIGTSSPSTVLDVQSGSANPAKIITSSVTNSSLLIGNTSTGSAVLTLDGANGDGAGADYFTIQQNNNLTANIYTQANAGVLTLGSKGTSNAITIDGANVGIGASPAVRLHVQDSASEILRVKGTGATSFINIDNTGTTGGGYVSLKQNSVTCGIVGVTGAYKGTTEANFGLFAETGKQIEFATNGSVTAKMVIASDGDIGIGTAGPGSRLEVTNAGASVGNYLRINNTSGKNWELMAAIAGVSNDGFGIYSVTDSTYRFVISSAGDVGIGTTSPAKKLEIASGDIRLGDGYTISWADDGYRIFRNGTQLRFDTNGSQAMTIDSSQNVSITGALSKGSGSFRIEHPLPAKADTHNLVHSFIEGPRADLIYRGIANLVDGFAEVDLDEAATMTTGTWELLCRDAQVFVQNESGWSLVRGSVSGSTLTINAQDNTSTDTVSWIVVAERKDAHMMDTNWTDDNGRVIVEPLKEIKA